MLPPFSFLDSEETSSTMKSTSLFRNQTSNRSKLWWEISTISKKGLKIRTQVLTKMKNQQSLLLKKSLKFWSKKSLISNHKVHKITNRNWSNFLHSIGQLKSVLTNLKKLNLRKKHPQIEHMIILNWTPFFKKLKRGVKIIISPKTTEIKILQLLEANLWIESKSLEVIEINQETEKLKPSPLKKDLRFLKSDLLSSAPKNPVPAKEIIINHQKYGEKDLNANQKIPKALNHYQAKPQLLLNRLLLKNLQLYRQLPRSLL